ncbi:hypothetical protein [Erwinia psidii]|uniref:hypothetical protein n=1 Tax=Erwinia psidii TaxID=69224 RepID=UPI000F527BF7|nr:hypothetical protein [Erwinia psidii]MCX8956219.1 hypothetical protein [Erwinia psidii]MCX8960021.1 hypothetical protein [Erwinia psidii]MCX8963566.1 hypothetical protein [Erwinia psidii]
MVKISKKSLNFGKLLVIIVSSNISLSLLKSAGIWHGDAWSFLPQKPARLIIGCITICAIYGVLRKIFLHYFSVKDTEKAE